MNPTDKDYDHNPERQAGGWHARAFWITIDI
jgi:hypothetical protein